MLQLSDLLNDESPLLSTRPRVEMFAQCLAHIILPQPPSDLPLNLMAPTCLCLLERLRSPLTVRLCSALLPHTPRVLEGLQSILASADDQERRLFLQTIDYLPANLENLAISLPQCVIQSSLMNVAALNTTRYVL